jgi:ABC-2 type transport system permease protein
MLSGKKKPGIGKVLLFSFLILYAIAAFMFLFGGIFYTLRDPFFSNDLGWMYFALLAAAVFSLCLIGTIFTASAQLFTAKDNELLLAMPIKTSSILISRLLVVLVFEYAFEALVALPALAVWLHGGYATAASICLFIVNCLLLPLLATAAALLVAWVLGLVTARMKHKSIFSLLLSVGFLLAYFYFASNMQNYMVDLLTKGAELAEALRRSMPPLYYFGTSIAEANMLDEALFALCMLLPFAAIVALLTLNYRRILTTNRGAAKTIYKEKAAKARSLHSALVRKELALYWNKPFVILNSSIGSLFLILMAGAVLVMRTDILFYLGEIDSLFAGFAPAALASVALVFPCTTNNLSSALVSLEGKNLWIAKHLPVATRLILQAKISAHMIVSALPCLITSLCMAAVFAKDIGDWLLILLLPLIMNIFIAITGTAINLLFPKLDWVNELQVVKQSLSSMLMMLGAMALIFGLGIVYAFLLVDMMTLLTFLWLCTAAFTVVSAAIYAWLATVGERIFREL